MYLNTTKEKLKSSSKTMHLISFQKLKNIKMLINRTNKSYIQMNSSSLLTKQSSLFFDETNMHKRIKKCELAVFYFNTPINRPTVNYRNTRKYRIPFIISIKFN